ncbi:hypothetical protein NQZ68_024624 [Dissostichus eleginoides]|nr:hypothetical protein NQZ68_024624 [Dissostichus eleginoides]
MSQSVSRLVASWPPAADGCVRTGVHASARARNYKLEDASTHCEYLIITALKGDCPLSRRGASLQTSSTLSSSFGLCTLRTLQ